jgi:hypothetical protein
MDLWNNLACGRLGEHATQNHWLPEFTQGDFFPKGQKKKKSELLVIIIAY